MAAWTRHPPVPDPDRRAPRRHHAVRVPGTGPAAPRRTHRAHRAPGPVCPIRRPSRDRGARPGPARTPEAHPGPRMARNRSPPLTVTPHDKRAGRLMGHLLAPAGRSGIASLEADDLETIVHVTARPGAFDRH